jgi:hypothetical protein
MGRPPQLSVVRRTKGGTVQPDRKTFVDRVGIGALFHYHAQ